MRRLLMTVLTLWPLATLPGNPQTVTLSVTNMSCPVCPITVTKALEQLPGVTDAKVDFDTKTATVTYDPDKADADALIKATTDAGFPSSLNQ